VANLEANGNWTGFEVLIGASFLIGVILLPFLFAMQKVVARSIYLWILTGLFTYSVLIFIVPKIEAYSQRANIEFLTSLANKDVYVKTLYFKSYAPYFYARSHEPKNPRFYDTKWLLEGEIDKDVYFITKIQHEDLEKSNPEVKKVGEKNGFVFYLRKKSQ
jgi:hypothetical protein